MPVIVCGNRRMKYIFRCHFFFCRSVYVKRHIVFDLQTYTLLVPVLFQLRKNLPQRLPIRHNHKYTVVCHVIKIIVIRLRICADLFYLICLVVKRQRPFFIGRGCCQCNLSAAKFPDRFTGVILPIGFWQNREQHHITNTVICACPDAGHGKSIVRAHRGQRHVQHGAVPRQYPSGILQGCFRQCIHFLRMFRHCIIVGHHRHLMYKPPL